MKFNSVFLAAGLLSTVITAAPTDIRINSPTVNSVSGPVLERRVKHHDGSHAGSSEKEVKALAEKAQKLEDVMDEQITTLKKEEKDVQTSKGSSGRITLAEVSADLTQATKADARAKKINLAFKKLLEKMSAGHSRAKPGTKLKSRGLFSRKKGKGQSSKEPDNSLTPEETEDIRQIAKMVGDKSEGLLQATLEREKQREKQLKQANKGGHSSLSANDIFQDTLRLTEQAQTAEDYDKILELGLKRIQQKADEEQMNRKTSRSG